MESLKTVFDKRRERRKTKGRDGPPSVIRKKNDAGGFID
jgi:hypothetical protein